MRTKTNPLPRFSSEDKERNFWAKHSLLDYFDFSGSKKVSFPNLKPTMRSISIRLPEDMLFALKEQANRQDVPYQSLAKVYLARQIRQELQPFKPGKSRSAKVA